MIGYARCPDCRRLTGVVAGKFRAHVNRDAELCGGSHKPAPDSERNI